MKFNIYNRFILEIVRENDQWLVFRTGEGTRRRERDLFIPSDLDSSELAGFLDDIYHELAEPGQQIKRMT